MKYLQGVIKLNATKVSNIVDDSFELAPEIEQQILAAGGSLYPSLAVSLTNKPLFRFKTRDLNLITAPLVITACSATLMAYGAVALDAGRLKFSITKGLAVPVSISAEKGSPAELSIDIYAASADGNTNPIAVATASTETPDLLSNVYTLGSWSVNAAASAGIQSLNVNFGYEIFTNEGEDGLPFPTEVFVKGQRPEIDIITENLAEATAARINTGQSITDTTLIKFRKLVQGAVPDGGLSLTMDASIANADSVSGGAPSNLALKIIPLLKTAASTNFFKWATFTGN